MGGAGRASVGVTQQQLQQQQQQLHAASREGHAGATRVRVAAGDDYNANFVALVSTYLLNRRVL